MIDPWLTCETYTALCYAVFQAKCSLSRSQETILTAFVRAFMPLGNHFPTQRTTGAILDLMHTVDSALTPEKILYCSVFALREAGAEGAGVRPCSQPTIYYGANSERPNCADCGNLRSNRACNTSMLRLRIADWIQVRSAQ